jgi:hypothetical protein
MFAVAFAAIGAHENSDLFSVEVLSTMRTAMPLLGFDPTIRSKPFEQIECGGQGPVQIAWSKLSKSLL